MQGPTLLNLPQRTDMLTSLLLILVFGLLGVTVSTTLRGGRQNSDKELQDLRERMLRLEQSMESMASDMDRMSESQRFMTALLEDRGRSQGALKPPPSSDKAVE